MSASGRGIVTKARLIAVSVAVAVAVCTIAIGWGLSESAKYQRQADDHAAEYAKYAHDYVGYGCVSMPALDKANCLAKARNERRAYERDEQDLVAQRQSALWAYIMGAAAVFGVGLSAVGVWLVYTTFNATREGNEIARDTARRQLRAYVNVTKVSISYDELNPIKVLASCAFHNHGETPAYDVKAVIWITCRRGADPNGEIKPYIIPGPPSQLVMGRGDGREIKHSTVLHDGVTCVQLQNEGVVIVSGKINYTDVFGRKHETSYRWFESYETREFNRGAVAATIGNDAT